MGGCATGSIRTIGEPNDYRIPDSGLHRSGPGGDLDYVSTVALAIEILIELGPVQLAAQIDWPPTGE